MHSNWGECESHTSEMNCDFSYLHVHIVYVFPYVFERDRKIFVQLDSHHNFRQLPLGEHER